MFVNSRGAYKIAEAVAAKEMKKKRAAARRKKEALLKQSEDDESHCSYGSKGNKDKKPQGSGSSSNNKKMRQRGSIIGKEIALPHDNSDGDDNTLRTWDESSGDESPHHRSIVSKKWWHDKMERSLRGIQDSIDTLTKQEEELSMVVKVHHDRAKSRYQSGNQMGALLSVKKADQTRLELNKVMQAIDYLQEQQLQLISLLNRCRTMACFENTNAADSPQQRPPTLPALEEYAQAVQQILAASPRTTQQQPERTDEQILSDFAASLGTVVQA